MGISVKISTPVLTLDEVAKAYGISAKRQRAITRIVEEANRQVDSQSRRRSARAKTSVPKSKAA